MGTILARNFHIQEQSDTQDSFWDSTVCVCVCGGSCAAPGGSSRGRMTGPLQQAEHYGLIQKGFLVILPAEVNGSSNT